MGMNDIRARLADVLREHLTCECGEWAEDMEQTCDHLADALLALPGIAIVALESGDLRSIARMLKLYGTGAADEYVTALLAAANTAEETKES
jgi:hypothetical protein